MTSPSLFGLLKMKRVFTWGKAASHRLSRRTARARLLVEWLEDRTVPSGGVNFLNPVNDPTLIPTLIVALESSESSAAVVAEPSPQLGLIGSSTPGQGLLPGPSPWFPNAYGFGSGTQPGQPWAPAAYSVGSANQPSFPWGRTLAYGQGNGDSPAPGDQPMPANESGDNDNQGGEGQENEDQRKESQKPEGQRDKRQGEEGTGDGIERLRGFATSPVAQVLPLAAHAILFVAEPNGGEADAGNALEDNVCVP